MGDEANLERALRHVDPEDLNALDVLRKLLHHDPNERYCTLREALEHPFFSSGSEDRVLKKRGSSVDDPRSASRPGHNTSSIHNSRKTKNTPRDQVIKTVS